jgi:hypothetical protein
MPVPQTLIRTSHAISIRANGTTIGQIQTWAPTQSRTITPAYELRSETSGEVTENVPGNITGLTIQVSRYDLFASKMETVWGTSKALWMLSSQLNPLEVEEKWRNPDSTVEKFLYEGCWFSQLGRNMQAQGDRIVLVNATLAYVRMRPLT